MPGPGYVVAPSGAREWVPDKWAYFQEHPESFQRTLDDINAVKAAAEARDTVQTQPQRVSTEKSFPGLLCRQVGVESLQGMQCIVSNACVVVFLVLT